MVGIVLVGGGVFVRSLLAAIDFLHVLLRLDEHTARTGRGIVDAHAFLRFNHLHHQTDDFGRRIELTSLFARTVGEVIDQVFVGHTEQIGELEVVVGEGDAVKVLDERL